MKLTSNGLHFIASWEGFRPKAYNDSNRVPNCTIGIGHVLHYSPCQPADAGLDWTIDHALQVLQADAAIAERAVDQAVKVKLGTIPAHDQTRRDMLCSLAFNIGAAGFSSSSLVREINLHPAPRDWYPLGPYWLEWDHDAGQLVPGLLNRRRAEFAIFAAGAYPAV
jgi:lysozyme